MCGCVCVSVFVIKESIVCSCVIDGSTFSLFIFFTVYVLFYTFNLTFFPQSAGAINTYTFGSNGLNPKKHRIHVRSVRQEAAKAFFYVKERKWTGFVLKTKAFFFLYSFLF